MSNDRRLNFRLLALVALFCVLIPVHVYGAPLDSLPQNVQNTASAVYGNGNGVAGEQINSTNNALHVMIASSSLTPASMPTQIYTLNGTTVEPTRSGDVNNATSAAGFIDAFTACRYNATLPTVTDTRYNGCQIGSRGALQVQIMDANQTTGAGFGGTAADGSGMPSPALATVNIPFVFNGTTWDRLRGASALGDGTNGTGEGVGVVKLYNGSTYDRARSAVAAGTAVNTGVVAMAPYKTDTANFSPFFSPLGDNRGANEFVGYANAAFDGTNYDRVRASTITIGTQIVSEENTFASVTTFGSTNVKASAAYLAGFSIDTPGLTGSLRIYDAANCNAGTVLTGLIASVPVTAALDRYPKITTTNGICVVTSGTGTPFFTLYYR